jgi:Spy/CpxP family protein refolding chaperone
MILEAMKNTLTAFLVTSAVATSLLLAQKPGNRPTPEAMVQHRVDSLTTELGLTSAQQQQAATIFTNAATAGASVHSNLRLAHQNLEAAVKNNDTAGIDAAATAIGNLTAQQISNESKAQAALYQILTPDQQAKFAQHADHAGFGRGAGFGGGPGRNGAPGRGRQ